MSGVPYGVYFLHRYKVKENPSIILIFVMRKEDNNR